MKDYSKELKDLILTTIKRRRIRFAHNRRKTPDYSGIRIAHPSS